MGMRELHHRFEAGELQLKALVRSRDQLDSSALAIVFRHEDEIAAAFAYILPQRKSVDDLALPVLWALGHWRPCVCTHPAIVASAAVLSAEEMLCRKQL